MRRKAIEEIPDQTPSLVERGFWLFKAFDVYENAKSLYATAKEHKQSEQLSTFGFVRFFAAIWVITYHNWFLNPHTSDQPPTEIGFTTFMKSGLLGVEYFFFIGGFLAAYILTGKASREGVGFQRYISDVFHRWVRVWPGLFLSVVVYWCGVVCLMNGPLWGRFIGVVKICNQVWWEKFLMIDNYLPQPGDYCASYTWYIDVDFQVYFAVLLVVFLYIQNRRLGYLVTFGLIIVSIIYGIFRYTYAQDNGLSTFEIWYENPLARSFEILIGVIFGFQFYERIKLKAQKNFFAFCENHTYLAYLLVAIGLFLNYLAVLDTIVIFGQKIPTASWEVLRRMIMCIGVAFVFLPISNGALPLIRDFMNLRIFQILGKLSFGAYLFHWPIMFALMYTQNTYSDSYDEPKILLRSLMTSLIVFAVSIPYYLLIEKPIINIENQKNHQKERSEPLIKKQLELTLKIDS